MKFGTSNELHRMMKWHMEHDSKKSTIIYTVPLYSVILLYLCKRRHKRKLLTLRCKTFTARTASPRLSRKALIKLQITITNYGYELRSCLPSK